MNFLVLHGAGVNMLKVGSKRRRTRREIEEQKQSELERENDIRTKLARLDMIEQQLRQANEQNQINKKASRVMSDLINAGVLREEAENSFVVENVDGVQRFEYKAPN